MQRVTKTHVRLAPAITAFIGNFSSHRPCPAMLTLRHETYPATALQGSPSAIVPAVEWAAKVSFRTIHVISGNATLPSTPPPAHERSKDDFPKISREY
ncbi:hypothetical protein [Solimonas sp. SE-A11]|uniref:hypothetical protein n=1 Tax=Solimonas sp. SE-A11 TaxID=3054954 RepID=UPI00259D047B|nr:hypothetical protein [Solimonas sp. SE-A11]MDM4769491.1 hypothetical protein [Solimonas sp. SE-A11]